MPIVDSGKYPSMRSLDYLQQELSFVAKSDVVIRVFIPGYFVPFLCGELQSIFFSFYAVLNG